MSRGYESLRCNVGPHPDDEGQIVWAQGFVNHVGGKLVPACREHEGRPKVIREWCSIEGPSSHATAGPRPSDMRAVLCIDDDDARPYIDIETWDGIDALGKRRWARFKDGSLALTSLVWLDVKEQVDLAKGGAT